MGLSSSVYGLASIVGPALGGLITDNFSWRWVFYINIPIGIIAMLFILFTLPNVKNEARNETVDLPGIIVFVLAIAPLLLALTWAGDEYSWLSIQVIGMLVFSAAMLVLFTIIEKKSSQPIIPLKLFQNSIFSISSLNMMLLSGILVGIVIFVPLFAQDILGTSAAGSGAILMPMMFSMVVSSALCGGFISKTKKYKLPSIFGMLVLLIGVFLLTKLNPESKNIMIISIMMLTGTAMGFTMPVFNVAVQNAYPKEEVAKLPLGYFMRHSSGEIRKTLVEDVEKLEKFFAHHICDFVKIITMPVTTIIILFGVSIPMTIASLVPLILGMGFQFLVFRSYNAMMEQYYRHSGRISATVIEYIRGMPVVKAFNKTTQTFLRFNKVLEDYRSFWMRFVKKTGLPFVSFSVCSDAGFLFVLPLGIILVAAGILSVPKLFLFLSVGVCYTMFIPMLAQVASTLSINMKNLDGVYSILDTPALREPDAGHNFNPNCYDIKIEGLTFSYEKNIPVLKNIDMEIKEGQTVAFVGPSGAGKSTMANLIARFYDPDQGRVLLGGTDLRNMRYNELMDYVSYVFQDNFSFGDTVLENIRMYRKDISREKVVEIAKLAQAHEFIEKLPAGYDTLLGSQGTYLSGGQLQRVNIARAILKDAPVIILDEATAFADPENENLIQRGLSVLLKNKTVIVIAHRLRTVRNADRIYVFNKGEITEQGSFDELMQINGLFHSMWEAGESSSKWKFSVRRPVTCTQ